MLQRRTFEVVCGSMETSKGETMASVTDDHDSRLANLRTVDKFADVVLNELQIILRSSAFLASPKSRELLDFLVKQKLLDGDSSLVERVIARILYQEETWNPKKSRLRQAACALRKRLNEYHARDGSTSTVRIVLPPGSFKPRFDNLSETPRPVTVQPASTALLVVHPLFSRNQTADRTDFGMLISSTITDALNQMGSVRAIPRSSSKKPPRTKRVAAIGCLELQGSLFSIGGSLVCQVGVVNTRNKADAVFARNFSVPAEDVIVRAREIAAEIHRAIVSPPLRDVPRVHEPPLDIYQTFQEGQRYLRRRKCRQDISHAIDSFELTIRRDPRYAPAHFSLADCYLVQSWYELLTPGKENFDRAKNIAQQGIDLDPTSGPGHATRAYACLLADFDWSTAEREFKTALDLDSHCAKAHHWYGNLLVMCGRFDEAVRHLEKAVEIDPASIVMRKTLGDPHYYSGNYPEAIRLYERALRKDESSMTRLFLGWAWQQSGDLSAAMKEFERAGANTSSMVLAAKGHALASFGQQRRACEIFDGLKLRTSCYISSHSLAIMSTALGDRDSAFHYLDEAYVDRIELLAWIQVEPRFASLRTDPRFLKLLDKLGLLSAKKRSA